MIKTSVKGIDAIKKALKDALADMETPMITVGIHEDAADPPEGEINMATLGAIQEYGADINHPGGTAYGYKTKQAAAKGQVRFLKAGAGYMVLGKTKPHKIKIPARPWLYPGFMAGVDDYKQAMAEGIAQSPQDPSALSKALDQVGLLAVGSIQVYMTELKSPPNKPATVERKKRSNPLIDEGHLRSSVTYKVQAQKPEEGL